MGRYCAVPMCDNTSNTPGISFHSFPSNAMKRKAWIIRMRRDEIRSKRITSYSRVCSAHFLKSDFKELKSGRRELKDDVEPTVFPFKSCTKKEPLYVLHPKDDTFKKLETKGIKWWPRKKREAWKKLNIPVTQKPDPEPVILKKSLEEIALINNATVSTISMGKQTAAIICPNTKTSENSSDVPQTSSISPAPTKVVLKFVPDVSSEKPNSFIPVFYVLPKDAPDN